MADDKSSAGRQDRAGISTGEDCEARNRSKKSGVFADEPKATMKSVGRMAKGVEVHLKNRKS